MTSPFRLMSYNRSWPQEFEQSRSLLLWASEGWISEVQHIGGTAVEEGLAQPVIDMMAGIDEMQGLNEAAGLLEGLNYSRMPSPDWCDDELTAYLHKPRVGEVTHTVLLVRRGGAIWQRTLAIRDHLQQSISDRQLLDTLKREHLVDTCDAAQRYAAAKNDFFHILHDHLK